MAIQPGDSIHSQLAAAIERAERAERECEVWRREADACAHIALRLQEENAELRKKIESRPKGKR